MRNLQDIIIVRIITYIVGHTFMLSWEMPLSKIFLAYSALIMSTLKGSTDRFFNFSAQNQNFTGGWTGPNLP